MASRPAAPASGAAARVLVVDPDVRFGLLLKGYLEERGWAADWVSDGRKALASWDSYNPHVVVTELQGEDLDGFEFLDALTRLPWPPPVVVCTRLKGASAWTHKTLRRLGVRRLLVRPVRFPKLAETLEQLMAELTGSMTALPKIEEIAEREGVGAGS